MTTKKINVQYDFQQTPILGLVLEKLTAAPSGPVSGRGYYNTTSNVGFLWNGAAFRPLDASALTDGSIKIAGLEVDPRARSTHTGFQLAATISDFNATVRANRLDQFAAPNVNVDFGGVKITSLADPASAQDAATKNYVDGAVQSAAAGIDSKPSVRALAATNIALTGTQNVDGVALVAGDRVLPTAQTTASQNGVYVVAAGAWSRALDADQTGEITPGAFWFVEEGTSYGQTQWRCSNTGVITIGTTAVTIVQFGASSAYTAGNGLTLTGNSFSVVADTGIQVTASGVKINTAIVARSVSGTITGDGATTSFNIDHNLAKKVVCQLFDATGVEIEAGKTRVSDNRIAIDFTPTLANTVVVAYTIVG